MGDSFDDLRDESVPRNKLPGSPVPLTAQSDDLQRV